MEHSADWTEIEPGRNKYVSRWYPEIEPQATLCLVHGLGEHGGRYHRLARDFNRAGFAVFAFDQQGHGRSSEPRGCVRSYHSLLLDIQSFLLWAREQFPDLPVILFGHSMGGNLVLNYALRELGRPNAVISSSPMITVAKPPGPLFVRLARLLSLVAPNYRLRSTVIPSRLMSDPEEQFELEQDKLFHSQLSLRLGGSLLDSGAWALRQAHNLQLPLLISHGTNDVLTSHFASAEFAHRAGATCELKIFEGQLHDPFRDIERATVIAEFVDFVRRQSSIESGK